MSILNTFITVLSMLIYAVPGFVLKKTKALDVSVVPALSKILVFVCQPCFAIYAYNKAEYDPNLFFRVLLFMALTVTTQLIIVGLFLVVYKKKWESVRYRICTIASCFGNAVFFGAPVIETLMPDFTEAVIFANAYGVGMNILAWTVGSAVITRDKNYIKIKKILLNPAIIGFAVAVVLYFFNIKLTGPIETTFTTLGKMTTPVSMIILGIRLATVRIKPIFTTPLFYFTVFFKQMVNPLICFGVISIFGFDMDVRTVMFIIGACPVASIVLNFAEMLGEGQEEAADVFLLGTIMSIVTMPLILQLLNT